MPVPQETITAEEKQSAVAAVLGSYTFARSEQLRKFLAFTCELEIGARAGEINEYLIGVEVFGRPEGYSTGDDSVVRSRAHSLRKKLQEFYAEEAPDAAVRVELPKGSYCPRFLRQELGVLPAGRTVGLRRRYGWESLAAAFAFGVLLAGAALTFWPRSGSGGASVDPTLRQVWGPLLEPGGSVLVCVATPAQLFVRQYPLASPPVNERPLSEPSELRTWYQTRHSLQPGNALFLHPTHGSPLWGDAAGAMRMIPVLSRAQVAAEIMPERVGQPFVLRGRNVLLFGRSEYSPAAALLLRKGVLDIRYDPASGSQAISAQDPRSGQRTLIGSPGRDYGLITVLPSEGTPDKARRTLVISGVTSAGTEAAADFFSSPSHMREFKRSLDKQGFTTWPRAYQIVVKTDSDHFLPLSVTYETHRVLEK